MAATPADEVWRRRAMRLLRYRHPDGRLPRAGSTPLLVVPSMINRHYVVDLMPGRSLVEHLLERGLDVYLIDWGAAGAEDRFLDFDSCIEDLLGAAVERTCRHAGVERVSLLGYCMGGTLAVIYTALHPARVANLINLAGPIDFSRAGVLAEWTDPRWFDVDLLVDSLGNVPAPMMQSGFLWLVPTSNAQKAVAVLEHADDADFMRNFQALEYWAADNIPFPGEAYRKYIIDLYQRNLLFDGRLVVRGRTVQLDSITCPVLGIIASRDHIVPPDCARPLRDLCASPDAEILELPGGHVGIVVGSGAAKHLWPALDKWLLPRSGTRAEPEQQGGSDDGAPGEGQRS